MNNIEDVAFITVYFPKHIIAHINVNWLSPVKVRTTLIGGEKKMLVWNDLEADEKIKVYDKGVSMSNAANPAIPAACTNCWSATAPATCGRRKWNRSKHLRAETAYFLQCIQENKTPFNDGVAGLRVVRMLEAADRSVRKRGEAVIPVSNATISGEFRPSRRDVKLGKDVKLSKFINMYGCEVGDETKVGRVRRRFKKTRASASAAKFPATRSSAKA